MTTGTCSVCGWPHNGLNVACGGTATRPVHVNRHAPAPQSNPDVTTSERTRENATGGVEELRPSRSREDAACRKARDSAMGGDAGSSPAGQPIPPSAAMDADSAREAANAAWDESLKAHAVSRHSTAYDGFHVGFRCGQRRGEKDSFAVSAECTRLHDEINAALRERLEATFARLAEEIGSRQDAERTVAALRDKALALIARLDKFEKDFKDSWVYAPWWSDELEEIRSALAAPDRREQTTEVKA